jgi:pantoate--beta-alanine ligase
MSQHILDLAAFRKFRKSIEGQSVGFVPTMGALHQGHAELLKRSKKENALTVLSIFVNPTQFNNASDLEKYPKTLETDIALAKSLGVDVVWTPAYQDLYPDNYRYQMTENSFSKILCGAHRPGHFDGVLSVVMKLFNIVRPQRSYFGEKDFQQYQLIKDMAQAYFLDIEIIGVPTIRETSGLAMSSRNMRLSDSEKLKASLLYKIMTESSSAEQAREQLEKNGFRVDYVEDIQSRRFAAAFLGEVRLIDNVKI